MNEKVLVIEDAKIIFRNFAGKQTTYNREGNRNFCVVIDDPKMAQDLIDDGWNLKLSKKRDDDDPDSWYFAVTVRFDPIPPDVWMVTNKKKTHLTEDNIDNLDYAELETADLTISPYHWEVNGNSGVKAYLKEGYFVIKESTFSEKYSHVGEDSSYTPPFGPPYPEDLPF